MDTEKADRLLRDIGNIFGEPDIADEAISDLPFYIARGDNPVVVGWGIFLDLLEVYERTEIAFWRALQHKKLTYYLTKKVRLQDAEDVLSIIALSAWNSLRSYRPDMKSWDNWLLMIAKGKINSFLRYEIYGQNYHGHRENSDFFQDMDELYEVAFDKYMRELIEWEERVQKEKEEDEKRRAIQVVAERWISGGHERKALFAAAVLSILNGELDYIGLSGLHMQRMVGATRPTLSTWAKQFVLEVHDESKS